jgi:hypothetical protein
MLMFPFALISENTGLRQRNRSFGIAEHAS